MDKLVIMTVLVAAALLYLSLQHKAALRRGTRIVLGILTTVCALVTAACIYLAIAASGKGGGVLLFFALPAGFMTWLFGGAYMASAKHEEYYAKSVDEKIAYNTALANEIEAKLRAEHAKLTQERRRILLSGRRRREIDQQLASIRERMAGTEKLRGIVERPQTYSKDEK